MSQIDFELMNGSFEVDVKYGGSLLDLKVNVDFDIVDCLITDAEPVFSLVVDFNVNIDFDVVDDGN